MHNKTTNQICTSSCSVPTNQSINQSINANYAQKKKVPTNNALDHFLFSLSFSLSRSLYLSSLLSPSFSFFSVPFRSFPFLSFPCQEATALLAGMHASKQASTLSRVDKLPSTAVKFPAAIFIIVIMIRTYAFEHILGWAFKIKSSIPIIHVRGPKTQS